MRTMTRRGKSSRGNALLEFTLVGIPLMFVLISTFEVARGMWQYNTFAHAIREGARFAAVHANSCAALPNGCTTTVQEVAQRIFFHGAGVVPDDVQNLEFIWGESVDAPSFTCSDLEVCLAGGEGAAANWWPGPEPGQPALGGGFWGMPVTINAQFRFRTAIRMFWPGSGPVTFGIFQLPASSTEMIHY